MNQEDLSLNYFPLKGRESTTIIVRGNIKNFQQLSVGIPLQTMTGRKLCYSRNDRIPEWQGPGGSTKAQGKQGVITTMRTKIRVGSGYGDRQKSVVMPNNIPRLAVLTIDQSIIYVHSCTIYNS